MQMEASHQRQCRQALNTLPHGGAAIAAEQCGEPHVWQAQVYSRASGCRKCPLCSGHKVCSCQSLAEQRNDLMDEWDVEGNARMDPPLNPWSLGLGSGKKALWKCQKHGIWSASILNRTKGATGCPGCANDAKRS